jgi:hypothetical protein
MKTVQVHVWNPDGSLRASLTYEAPDSAQPGDDGTVPIHDRRTGRDEVFYATITDETPSYTGKCRPFSPAP